MILEEFIIWEDSHRGEIVSVQEILVNQLPDDSEGLIAAACEIEGHYSRIGSLLAESNSFLSRAKMILRPEKEFGSEMDRRTELDGKIATVKMVTDKLENLTAAIKQRLILIEALLKYHCMFIERKGKVEL